MFGMGWGELGTRKLWIWGVGWCVVDMFLVMALAMGRMIVVGSDWYAIGERALVSKFYFENKIGVLITIRKTIHCSREQMK